MSGVGGGIWCEADNQPFLRGLTSFGKSCDADGYPGVGVNIAEFYGWLKATITRAPVCQPGACYPGVCIETIDNPAGFICKGTDPCTDEIDDCPSSSECVPNKSSPDGYDCICAAGYELIDGDCVDVDECISDPCGPLETCENNEGKDPLTRPIGQSRTSLSTERPMNP